MTTDSSSTKTWLAYITAEVVHKCIKLCQDECLACKNNVISPLLHFHNELNLMDKIHRHLGNTFIDLDNLFDQFILQFGWFALNRENFIQLGKIFLDISTPEAIIYGKYLNTHNDHAIYGHGDITVVGEDLPTESVKLTPTVSNQTMKRQPPPESKPIKPKRSKKSVISQNDAPGKDL